MSSNPIVWSIAGSDSGGGAGIQADLKTFTDLKCFGATLITAITAQNTQEVNFIEAVSDRCFTAQLDALTTDLMPVAIKSGMLSSCAQVTALSQFLTAHPDIIYICDPVMIATCGDRLVSADVIAAIKHELFPKATLITPNLIEAHYLCDLPSSTTSSQATLGLQLLQRYHAKAVLLKGGHAATDTADDYFCSQYLCSQYHCSQYHCYTLHAKRYPLKRERHGTGCTLSAAITAFLARGYDLNNALVLAKAYISQGIADAITVGAGALPVAQSGFPCNKTYFPHISLKPNYRHKPCQHLQQPLGFYPIVDTSDWVLRLAKLGVKTIQLRIKDKPLEWIEQEIVASINIAQQYDIQLFINDYWQLAIRHHAYGVHLGHEDLQAADIDAIAESGLRLGLSTHDHYELACALHYHPSYIALGPIYATTSKVMRFAPQGLKKLRRWRAFTDLPLVAIGGITLEHIAALLAHGADGIAIISLVTKSDDPVRVVRQAQRLFSPANTSIHAGLTHVE